MSKNKIKIFWDSNKPTILLLLTILIAWILIYTFVVTPTTVSGPSMNPNLQNGEKCLAFKMVTPKRGDVIAFNAQTVDPDANGKKILYVKRIIGLPGDKVTFDGKNLYVNDKQVNQATLISKSERTNGTAKGAPNGKTSWNLESLGKANEWKNKKATVPQNCYFVLGDNRSVSNDSRYFGYVPQNTVIGVVKAPMWHFGKRRWHINKFHNKFFAVKSDNSHY